MTTAALISPTHRQSNRGSHSGGAVYSIEGSVSFHYRVFTGGPTYVRAAEASSPTQVFSVSQIGSGFVVTKSFNVTIKQLDHSNYVARFAAANINASGNSPEEALRNWKEVLAFKFAHYGSFPSAQLASGPRRQLAVLKGHMKRK